MAWNYLNLFCPNLFRLLYRFEKSESLQLQVEHWQHSRAGDGWQGGTRQFKLESSFLHHQRGGRWGNLKAGPGVTTTV